MPSKKQPSKRIHKVTILRMVDESPDTSWLGEYSNEATSEFAIDRKHAKSCTGFWANADLPDDARECDCSSIGHRQMPYFNPGSVEAFKADASWIPPTETDKRGYWFQAMKKNAIADYERAEAFNAGDFYFIGIRAEAEVSLSGMAIPNPVAGTVVSPTYLIQRISSGGCWGIESDAGYFAEVEAEQLSELRSQLSAIGFGKRAISAAFKGGTYGSSTQRTILYLTDRIIVRCNSCGNEITYMKGAK